MKPQPLRPQQPKKQQTSFNLFKLFQKQDQDPANDLNSINIQSTKSKRQIQISTQRQYESQPRITNYTQKNLENDELCLINLAISGGEIGIFFRLENEPQIVQNSQQGVQILSNMIMFNAKHFQFILKIVRTKNYADCYLNGEFLASYQADGIYVKFLEKGSVCEVVEGQEM